MNTVAHCAVLGSPIAHSLSPLIFRTAFQAGNIAWDYTAIDVAAANFNRFVAEKDSSWRGFSVTMPHKITAAQFADHVSVDVERIGAANTLYRDSEDKWCAANTDICGIFSVMIQAGLNPVASSGRESTIVLVGAGGTARAVLAACVYFTSEVTLAVRDARKGASLDSLAKNLGIRLRIISLEGEDLAAACQKADIAISTLPAFAADPYAATIATARSVCDVVYSPWPTRLATEAIKNCDTMVSGGTMLIYQALEQYELFTSHPAPVTAITKAFKEQTGINVPSDLMRLPHYVRTK